MKDISELTYRLQWNIIGWLLVILIIYLSLTPNPPVIVTFPHVDKIEHLLAYGVLMAWFGQIVTSVIKQISLVIGLCLLGVSLEFLQGWTGYRDFEYTDMVADTAGVLLGWWVSRFWCKGWLIRVDKFISRR
ncbi:MAG: VanZ family protein [Gammaproteobacteria bacterium]|nr:VanZ family protein [Gammaproteobacteria bacterium]